MKIIGIAVLLVAVTAYAAPAAAQDWVPENGYWEVITHVTRPRHATVRFYDLENHLLYEERVEGKRLDLRNHKTCLRLNTILQTALAAWKEHRPMRKEEGLVVIAGKL